MPNVVQRRVALLSDDGKFADSMTPQAVLDAVEHVDQAARSATAAANSASAAAQAAWNAVPAGTYLVPDPSNPGLYLPTAGSAMVEDPAHDGLYTIGPLA